MSHSVLPDPASDFPAWYLAVVERAGLAEHGPARGSQVLLPWGCAIWELLRDAIDVRLRASGHENVSFPLLIPESVLAREGALVAGFAPEVAVVTRAGGRELAEPLVVRPTSEAIVWSTYARWIQSWRDLPLLYNQWGNVVRWELRPRLLLRSSEFLWQEGHTAHRTAAEARAEALRVLVEVYADVAEQVLALPVLVGRKSARERFPGACETFAIEALMRDGKALQAGTSHDFGTGLAEAYDVTFTDEDGQRRRPHATSWGASTRLLGAVVMAHGDDRGLRLPPAVAPRQVAIVPLHRTDAERDAVRDAAGRLRDALVGAGVRTVVDERADLRAGARYAHWELRGVPVRLELGPRELAAGTCTLVRRDGGARETCALADAVARVGALLVSIQASLLAEARAFRAERTARDPDGYAALVARLWEGRGLVEAPFCGSTACEEQVREDTRAAIRCLPLDQAPLVDARCVVCGAPADERAVWAQAY